MNERTWVDVLIPPNEDRPVGALTVRYNTEQWGAGFLPELDVKLRELAFILVAGPIHVSGWVRLKR